MGMELKNLKQIIVSHFLGEMRKAFNQSYSPSLAKKKKCETKIPVGFPTITITNSTQFQRRFIYSTLGLFYKQKRVAIKSAANGGKDKQVKKTCMNGITMWPANLIVFTCFLEEKKLDFLSDHGSFYESKHMWKALLTK